LTTFQKPMVSYLLVDYSAACGRVIHWARISGILDHFTHNTFSLLIKSLNSSGVLPDDFNAIVRQAAPDIRQIENLRNFGIEFLDNLPGGSGRCEKACQVPDQPTTQISERFGISGSRLCALVASQASAFNLPEPYVRPAPKACRLIFTSNPPGKHIDERRAFAFLRYVQQVLYPRSS